MRRPRPASAPDRLATYRLVVEYDGSRFAGWQIQKNARTVVGALDEAFRAIGVLPLDLGGAGRTDAGVHALGQVAHLRVAKRFPPGPTLERLNEALPAGVQALSLKPAQARFHARHDAVARSYLYQLARRRTAFAKRYVWWVKPPLDVERLRAAAALVPGRHDFAAFARDAPGHDSTIVVVEAVEVVAEGDLVLVRIVASHFLWRMVRRLVGTLVEVGTGRLSVEAFERLLSGDGEGDPGAWTAPAAGLFLETVLYPGDELPPLRPVTPLRGASAPDPPAFDSPRPGPGRRAGPRKRRRGPPAGD